MYCDTDYKLRDWGGGVLFHFALKLSSFRFKKLLYFGSKVVTIRVSMLNFVVYHLSLTPVFIELLLIILKVLHF